MRLNNLKIKLMCWSDNKAIPIVLKKPLRVYKVGTSILGCFISLYQETWYPKNKIMPTVEICPEFMRCNPCVPKEILWECDTFYIHEGYHSYLTEEMAKYRRDEYDIGVFEIPSGATIYVNYRYQEIVSTDIKYLGLLK